MEYATDTPGGSTSNPKSACVHILPILPYVMHTEFSSQMCAYLVDSTSLLQIFWNTPGGRKIHQLTTHSLLRLQPHQDQLVRGAANCAVQRVVKSHVACFLQTGSLVAKV